MQTNVQTFLEKYFCQDERQISKLIQTEYASDFLLIWSIFESKIFDGYCTITKVKKYPENHFENAHKKKIETIVEYFHKRYQDKVLWKNLNPKDDPLFTAIKNKEFSDISNSERCSFLVYVIYRYRNNIFHGNKKIDAWLNFEDQIVKCTESMIILMENRKIKA